ncbi:MAG: hypothetical protein JWP11_2211 [Frankiales bacterium]|nr:hypothetical protein [Frankiales bacterium]
MSTATITRTELDHRLTALADAMRAAGIDPTGLTIEHGSRAYGRAFRLYMRDSETGGLRDVPTMRSSYLGVTKNEADRALRFLIDGLHLATSLAPTRAQ